ERIAPRPLDVGSLKIGLETKHEAGVDLPIVADLATTDEAPWRHTGERTWVEGEVITRDARVRARSPAIPRVAADIPTGPAEHRQHRRRRLVGRRPAQVGRQRRACKQQHTPNQT